MAVENLITEHIDVWTSAERPDRPLVVAVRS